MSRCLLVALVSLAFSISTASAYIHFPPATLPKLCKDSLAIRVLTIKKFDILSFDDAEIALLDLDTGKWKTIIRGGSFARYVPTGHIAYARNGSIMAVPGTDGLKWRPSRGNSARRP